MGMYGCKKTKQEKKNRKVLIFPMMLNISVVFEL